MKLERYIVVKDNSGSHNAVAYCDVDSYVYMGTSPGCSVDDLVGELAREESDQPANVKSRILGCNPGLPQSLSSGSLVRVKTEKAPSQDSVLEELPLAGGPYLKFLKLAIQGAKWVASQAQPHASAEDKRRWEGILSQNRSKVIADHAGILKALNIPLGENSFEKFFNKVIPDFLKKKGVNTNLLQLLASPDGLVVFRFEHMRILTCKGVETYA
ncbi:MAG: hypothetical protein JNM27_12630 [Leptospirales bacterium]|nr:hypothetical protein [Leptospirales bacterium]